MYICMQVCVYVFRIDRVSYCSMQAQYPANTNVLFVDLPSVEKIASAQNSNCLPGMILNLNKRVVYKDYLGVTHRSACAHFILNLYDVMTLGNICKN